MLKTRQLVRSFLGFAILATTLQAGEAVLLLSGAGGTSTQVPVFLTNPFQAQTTLTNVPTSTIQVLQTPDGQKNYLISNTSGTGVTVLDGNFSGAHVISASITLPPTVAALSPDGRRLVVIAGNVYIFDTATDTLLTPNGLALTGTNTDVAFALDSSKAYVLSNSGTTGIITPVDLTQFTTSTALTLPGAGAGVVMGPAGFLYVTTLNRLFEINPRTMAITPSGEIAVNGNPGKPIFTQDGRWVLAINRTPVTGTSIMRFDLSNHTVAQGFPNFSTVIDKLINGGTGRIYAYSTQSSALFDVSTSEGVNVTPSALSSAMPTTVLALALSNELPARTMYAVAVSNGQAQLYKIDLPNLQSAGQVVVTSAPGQVVAYANSNPTSGATTILAYNTTQVVQPGAISNPLVTRILDSLGRPVYGARITYSTSSDGVNFNPASTFTNTDGYAQTLVTAPSTPGDISVDASAAGTPGTTFKITVPGTNPGGGGTGTGGSTGLAAIKIHSGNGQVVQEHYPATQPLTVQLLDGSGKPVSDVPVTFAITQGRGGLINQANGSVLTDENGLAFVGFSADVVSAGLSFEQAVITASSTVGSVNFVVTTVLAVLSNSSPAAPPIVQLNKPDLDTTFRRVVRGGAGTIVPGAIQVQVVAASGPGTGLPIPGVALNVAPIVDPSNANVPGGTCVGGAPLTDANGIATCDVLLNNVKGSGLLDVNVGGFNNPPQITVDITTGPPTTVTKASGDNQSGKPGDTLPQQLRVRVTDASSSPLQNIALTWSITKGTGTLVNASTVTDVNGNGVVTLKLGSNPGTINVKVVAGSGTSAPSAVFTETVTVLVGSISVLGGNNQTVTNGQAFPQALQVQVNDLNNAPVAGQTVTFTVASGSATLSAATATTDATGKASVTATAGSTPGNIVINASAGTQAVTFTLTVRQAGPAVTAASFVNAASGAGGLAPCGIAVVQGTSIVPSLTQVMVAQALVGPLPVVFQGVDLSVNGVPAPIYYAGPNAVAFQTPCETAAGTATVAFRVNGGTTTISGVPVAALQPGIFETTFASTGSKKYAVLVRPDGSYVTPDNPARRGEQIKMFATGLGQVTTPTGTNKAGVGGQTVNASLLVGVNNGGVRLVSTEYMVGEIGLYVITFEIPADAVTGTYQPLALIGAAPDGSSVFSNPSYLPIQ